MSSVPVLAAPAFAATLNVMVALPLPLAPVLMVTQGTRLLAVQAQFAGVVIVRAPEPPDEGIDAAVGCSDRVHAGTTGRGCGLGGRGPDAGGVSGGGGLPATPS